MSETGGDTEAAGGARDPFELLMAVQDLDTTIAQLTHRLDTLPERRELAEAEARLRTLDARVDELLGQRQGLLQRQAELETQIGQLNVRRTSLENRMYGARGSASRDLQAMDEEVAHLKERQAELEDEELALMEDQEPLDATLTSFRPERDLLAEAVDGFRTALGAAEVVLRTERQTLESNRALLAAQLPADLSERYEKLRARLKGTGAARLVGSRCEGCHLELPSMEVERIRRLPADAVVTCEQCGRILVRAPGAR